MRSVVFYPDAAIIESGYNDYRLILWDKSTGKLLKTLEGHTDYVRSMSFSPDGSIFFNGSNDYKVKIGEKSTRNLLKNFKRTF